MKRFRHYFWYTLGSFISQCGYICLVLIMIRVLPPQEIGFFSLFTSSIFLCSTLISFGLRQLFFIEFFHVDAFQKRFLINDIIMLYLMCAVPLLSVVWLVHSAINNYFFAGLATPSIFACMLIQIFLTFFTELLYQALVYRMQSAYVALLKITSTCILVGSTLGMFFLNTHSTILPVIVAQTASLIFVACCGVYEYLQHSLHTYSSPVRTLKNAAGYLRAGAPFLPAVTAGWLLTSCNKWMLSWYGDLAAVALYSVADYVTPVFNMLILYPLGSSYVPLLLHSFAKDDADIYVLERRNRRLMWALLGGLFIVGTVGYYIGAPYIALIMPAYYEQSLTGAYWIAMAQCILAGTYFLTAILQFTKQTWMLAASITAAAVYAATSAWLFIPYFGINGCYMSIVTAQMFYFIILFFAGKRVVRNEMRVRAAVHHNNPEILPYLIEELPQEEALR